MGAGFGAEAEVDTLVAGRKIAAGSGHVANCEDFAVVSFTSAPMASRLDLWPTS